MVGGCSCGSPREVKRTLVNIGDATIGLAKLDRVFEELYNSKKSPNDVDGEEIVDLASFYNYIPPHLVGAYAEALLEEYKEFYRDKECTTA
ncbi:MAG: hypothetical protein C4B59_06565 [Candidatus Methanogaster sp.]|uniref:Uncharacterized protein n=1 Tax=Candidatus Methanogaster sp. TaxID=3386292 RepID=A0AC61L3M5_9EURY|nr:MAG: hypothetical protein C4B59_06565 [ANME-2 cluster archaeon]